MLDCSDMIKMKYVAPRCGCCTCCDHLGMDGGLPKIRFKGNDGLTKTAQVCCKVFHALRVAGRVVEGF